MEDDEFNRQKDDLQKKISQLLAMGKVQMNEREAWEQANRKKFWWQKYRKRNEFDYQQHMFEKNCIIAEREFQKLD